MPGPLLAILLATALSLAACTPADPLQSAAQDYVTLALTLDAYKPGEVDTWFGAPELRRSAATDRSPLDLLAELDQLSDRLQGIQESPQRQRHLQQKLTQLRTVLELLGGDQKLSFAAEAQHLYGIELPEPDQTALRQEVFDELSSLLPGSGSLALRVAKFRRQLLIPADKRKAVFERALAECRARTLSQWPMPAAETLTLQWSRDVAAPWHRYDGNYHSTLILNDLGLAFASTPVDVACHEGYPGHHAQFVLFESAATQPLPPEDRLVLLRSPESALREAAAELGVTLALPADERLRFERDVLFPLAGLDPALAETNLRINALLTRLSLLTVPLIQEYRDGISTYNAITFKLDREALVSSPAELLRFVDEFGAYSVGYTVLRERLATQLGTGTDAWEQLAALLRMPDALPAGDMIAVPATAPHPAN